MIEDIWFVVIERLYRAAYQNVIPRFSKRRWFPILNLDRKDLDLLWHLPLVALYSLLPIALQAQHWKRLRPNVVCCFGNNPESARAIADCARVGIRTVLCIASDSDLDNGYRPSDDIPNDYGMPRWMGHYAIENADRIFVQTEQQQRLLAERFGRAGDLVRNPVKISSRDPQSWPLREVRDTVLWIGRCEPFNKRPLLFLELARRCPELSFTMIANRSHADVFDALQAQCPANLTIIESVPHSEIWKYFRRARVFVNTSVYEGFPNTFLQCAVSGVPVVSLQVNPDEAFSHHRCGFLANGDIKMLDFAVRQLWSDHSRSEHYALTFHHHALVHHSLDSESQKFAHLLQLATDEKPRYRPLRWWYKPFERFTQRPTESPRNF